MNVILDEINRDKDERNKIRIPICERAGRGRAMPICFRFSGEGTRGCPMRTCRFLHVDLADTQWIRDNLHRQFLPDFLTFLEKPEVKVYFQATAALKSFLGNR